MFGNEQVTTQPIFYLFIAATILLSLGYGWGRRRNRRIFLTAFDDLKAILKPRDQQYTNIGGLSGYHANFLPNKNSVIRRADVTITLLPRQSWLWYPFSFFIRKFDRLFLNFELSKSSFGALKEGHLIEKRYARLAGARIENADSLQSEELTWDGLSFILYFEDEEVKQAFLDCKKRLQQPNTLRHLALVPERQRIFLFMIPRMGTVDAVVRPIYDWFHDLLNKSAKG
ncbi:MAG: hypothetical protein ACOC25_01250 [Alkalispirochaetaceae bacterium]